MKTFLVALLLASAAAPSQSTVNPDPATGMEFVLVKGGCFPRGDTFGDGLSDEQPVHEVCVSDFLISRHEVTQKLWETVMGNNRSEFKGDYLPATNVSWNDAQAFITRLNQLTGKRYRLPTEAEWEYAARSGGRKEKFAGADHPDPVAWYDLARNKGTNRPYGPQTVMQKQPNGLGIFDLSGNVWEWCQDWYDKDYYYESPRLDPKGPDRGSYRVRRGGSWGSSASYARAARRGRGDPGGRSSSDGFRLILPAVQ